MSINDLWLIDLIIKRPHNPNHTLSRQNFVIWEICRQENQDFPMYMTWILRSNSHSSYISLTLTFAVLSPIQRNGAPRLSYWADPSIGRAAISSPLLHCVSLNLHPHQTVSLHTSNNTCLPGRSRHPQLNWTSNNFGTWLQLAITAYFSKVAAVCFGQQAK